MSVFASGTTKEIEITGIKIKLKKLSYGEQKEMMKLSKDDPTAMLDLVLLKSITDWDVEDDGKKAPISTETLDKCEADFINLLSKEVLSLNNISLEQAKNSPELSEQA